jgi:hypothetical protein
MENWLIAVIVGAALGLLLGIKIARDSNKKQPVHGALAHVFHYIACSGLSGMLPFIIAGVIIGLPFLALFGTAVGFLALTGVSLLVYASVDQAPSVA